MKICASTYVQRNAVRTKRCHFIYQIIQNRKTCMKQANCTLGVLSNIIFPESGELCIRAAKKSTSLWPSKFTCRTIPKETIRDVVKDIYKNVWLNMIIFNTEKFSTSKFWAMIELS